MTFDNYISSRAILSCLGKDKFLIGLFVVVLTVSAAVVTIFLPDVYRAEAILVSNTSTPSNRLTDLASQFGGIAGLAGLNFSQRADDKSAVGLEILRSRKFISNFVERHELLVSLIAAKSWDRHTDFLQIDSDLYNTKNDEWIRDVSPPKKRVPSAQEAYDKFMDLMSIEKRPESGLVIVSVEHISANVARQWVEWLVSDLNRTVMEQDVAEARQAIDYLNTQIEQTSLAGLQGVLYRLVEEQLKIVILAEVSNEYLFKTIDPAIAPETKHKPQRSLIVVLSFLISGMVGVMLSLIRDFLTHRGNGNANSP